MDGFPLPEKNAHPCQHKPLMLIDASLEMHQSIWHLLHNNAWDYLLNARDIHMMVNYYGYVIMGALALQITSPTIVYLTVYSDTDQRKHQSSASLAFVRGFRRGPVNSLHKWPVTRKMFPFDDVIMRFHQGFYPFLSKCISINIPCKMLPRNYMYVFVVLNLILCAMMFIWNYV